MLDSSDYRRLIQALSSPSMLLSKSFQVCTFFTCKEQIIQVQSYTCIYDRLDEQYIECLIKNIHQTWYMKEINTKLEEEFSLLTIVNEISVQPNSWDKDSSETKGFWVVLLQILLKIYHQHNFSLQVWLINSLPKASIYTLGNRVVSKVEEVETIDIVTD